MGRARASGEIEAIVPPEIASLSIGIPASLQVAIHSAERALATMDTRLSGADPSLVETATFALLRAESLSSSRIEGLSISHRRLAEALYDPAHAKRLASEVANNVTALRAAIALGVDSHPITSADVQALHALLMKSVPGVHPGQVRDVQNWIGPSGSPFDAVYVPPPATEVSRLMEDLVRFINRNDLPPVLHAAIAHGQFEAIHPFVDGNGRVGRCLTSIILRRHSCTNAIPPVSGVLLRNVSRYYEALAAFQQDAKPWPWVEQFSHAIVASCESTEDLTAALGRLTASWMQRAGNPRRGSITARLIEALPTLSFTDAAQVAEQLSVDPNVARRGLNALTEAGILSQVAGSKRDRVWRADELHQLLDMFSSAATDQDPR